MKSNEQEEKKILINRVHQNKKVTIGLLNVMQGFKRKFTCYSLERGWNNNFKNISCIPVGTYTCVWEYSPRFGRKLLEIKGVHNRSECKFHSANFWEEINGCIAPAVSVKDLNNDSILDVSSSRIALLNFEKEFETQKEVQLTIVDSFIL